MQRVDPEHLIKSVAESKMAQKRTTAKLVAEKKRNERLKLAKRTVTPMDLSKLKEDSMIKLVDLMAVSFWRCGKSLPL
jgi:hypothetical protein